MGHDTHFLERLERLNSRHVDAAFALYRDPELVKLVLKSAAIPDNADRVALSLDDPIQGPFIVVTREGKFVTCLGVGMNPKAPVVKRGQLDAFLAKMEKYRERMAEWKRVTSRYGNPLKLWDRIARSGHRLSREEFVAASYQAPFVANDLIRLLFTNVETIVNAIHRFRASKGMRDIRKPSDTSVQMLQDLWNVLWMNGHIMALVYIDGEVPDIYEEIRTVLPHGGDICRPAVLSGLFGPLVRYAWAAGRVGKPLLRDLKAGYAESDCLGSHISSLSALTAIGARNLKLQAEVLKVVEKPSGYLKMRKEKSKPEAYEILSKALSLLPAALAPADNPTLLFVVKHLLHSCDVTLKRLFKEATDIPDALAQTSAANIHCNVLRDNGTWMPLLLSSIAVSARLPAENLYFDEKWLKIDDEPWTPRFSETYFVDAVRAYYGTRVPVKNEEEPPGRNDPCACGSGKKYKKCCGG